MSIIEDKIISQVNFLPAASTINVQWANRILKDGVVIAETYERKAYAQDQKAEFLVEVDNAATYISVLGW